MKAIVINGSPRGKNGNSQVMADFFCQGMQKAGVEVETILLLEEKLEYCRGCFGCWTRTPGKCVIDDAMNDLISRCLNADYLIYATPVYYYTMPAILKNFIDRTLPISTPQIHKNDKGEFYHEGRYKKYPQTILLTNCGFPGKGNFEGIITAFFFLNPVLTICRNQGGLLNSKHPKLTEIISAYGKLLKTAGQELVTKNCVSDELMQKLSENLIPDEMYMKAVNQGWEKNI